MGLIRFIFSKVFLINLVIAIALVTLICVVTLKVLAVYTHHGESFSVPDFQGKTLEEVEQICLEKTLLFQVNDSVYDQKAVRGTVVDQSPEKEFQVKENRTIFLTINAFYPERVAMPKIIGISLRQAMANLETYGLKCGKLIYRPDIARDIVLDQMYKGKKISAGILIEKGQSIDLVLGQGRSNEKNIVPSVIGMNLEQATEELAKASFNIGSPEFDETVITSEDTLDAIIYNQRPKHHTKTEVRLGTYIDVWLSMKDGMVTPPDTTEIMEPDGD